MNHNDIKLTYAMTPSLAPGRFADLPRKTNKIRKGNPMVIYVMRPVAFNPKAVDKKMIKYTSAVYPTFSQTMRVGELSGPLTVSIPIILL